MNFRLTLTLSIILLLVVTTWIIIANRPASLTPANPEAKAIIQPEPADLKAIDYSVDGDDQLKFARNGATWNMTFPVNAAVDSSRVDSIAKMLCTLSYRDKFTPETAGVHSAASTGTEKPHEVIKFTDTAGKEYTLSLGSSSSAGIYATLSGDKSIFLLSRNPLTDLDHEADYFRDKNIKSVSTDNVVALTVSHGKDAVQLAKTSGKWLLTAPVAARANATTVSDILNELRTITADKFTTLSRDLTGLNPPLATVTAVVQEAPATAPADHPAIGPATAPATAPSTKITLELGYYTDAVQKQFVYACLAGSNEIFTLPASSFTKLDRELKDLRDPAITPAPVTEATDVTIAQEGAPAIALNKKDNAWTMASQPAPLAADAGAIENFLGALRDERAIHYVDNAGDLKSIGLDPPRTKIEMTIPGQSQHEVVLLGKPETADSVTPMMRQGEPTVYLVQTSEAAKLSATPLTFRDRQIERLAADQIRSIAISGPEATDAGLTVEREGLHWVVKAGKADKGVAADDAKITALLADFTPLTAQGYLAENAAQSGAPGLTVTVSILEPTVTTAPASAPATGPAATTRAAVPMAATSTTPATASRPSIQDALESRGMIGPDLGKIVTRTLHLYKVITPPAPPATVPATTSAPATAAATMPAFTWKAVWDAQTPAWTFEPTATLIEHLTKVSYAAPPATQAGTQPATLGATTRP